MGTHKFLAIRTVTWRKRIREASVTHSRQRGLNSSHPVTERPVVSPLCMRGSCIHSGMGQPRFKPKMDGEALG